MAELAAATVVAMAMNFILLVCMEVFVSDKEVELNFELLR